MSTLKDVAVKAGVSTATVSNVLTGAKPVGPELKQKILDAIQELNYSPRRSSKKPSASLSRTLGVIMTQLDCIFFPLVISGIQKIATENNYDITFYPTNYDRNLEKKYVQNLVKNNVAGIILDTVIPLSDIEYFKSLTNLRHGSSASRIPVISIQEDLTDFGITSVTLDSIHGGFMATEHLIKKGCSKIACITGPLSAGWAVDRLKGYQECLAEHGLSTNSSYFSVSDCTLAGGYQAANLLLMNAIDFDGIVVQNDLMAIGALKALREKGYKIPDEVKLIGYDNVFVGTFVSPSITSIHIPKQRLGEEAARHLIQEIQEPAKCIPHKFELPLSLIERQTTNIEIPENWDLFLA